jgi:hypothetical protein
MRGRRPRRPLCFPTRLSLGSPLRNAPRQRAPDLRMQAGAHVRRWPSPPAGPSRRAAAGALVTGVAPQVHHPRAPANCRASPALHVAPGRSTAGARLDRPDLPLPAPARSRHVAINRPTTPASWRPAAAFASRPPEDSSSPAPFLIAIWRGGLARATRPLRPPRRQPRASSPSPCSFTGPGRAALGAAWSHSVDSAACPLTWSWFGSCASCFAATRRWP